MGLSMKLYGHMETVEKVDAMDELTKPELYETPSDGNNINTDERNNTQEERIEPFTLEEALQLTRMDSIHNPVLAEYWGDDSDDDLIANP